MAALYDMSESDLTLDEAKEYLRTAITEHWSGARFDDLAQFILDVTETE